MNTISRLQTRQLIVLAVLALVTLTYTGIHYARLGSAVGIGEYTVRAVFPDSGGIFTDAEVTYQGVAVGRVSALRLTNAGVDVDLRLKTGAARVPAASTAVVADRSAVGEQFVDLRPTSAAGPFLHEGSVITDVAIPPPLDTVISSAVDFTRSIPLDDLTTVVSELGKAFDGRGDDLSRLIDSLSHLSQAGYDNLPQTVSLIRDSDVVLGTQADQSDSILDWSHNIDLVAAQLQSGDPDLRRLLTTGNLSATQLSALLQRSGGDATTAIRNLATDVRTISPTFDRVSPAFALLSAVSSATGSVARGDGTIHFGAVLETNNPPSCTYGYEGTQQIIDDVKKKNPAFNIDYDDFPFNTAANCDVAQGNPTDVRGAGRAVLSDPSIPQPWDKTPKKDPDTLNLNPLATQLATLLGVHPTGSSS